MCPPVCQSGYAVLDDSALKWLAEDRVKLDGLIALHNPLNPQEAYQSLLKRRAQGLFQIFDWSKV